MATGCLMIAAVCAALAPGSLNDIDKTPGDVRTTDKETICTQSTKTIRSVSQSTKKQAYASYGVPWECRHWFEVDHLVSLELGGSNAITNLWPQPYSCIPKNRSSEENIDGNGILRTRLASERSSTSTAVIDGESIKNTAVGYWRKVANSTESIISRRSITPENTFLKRSSDLPLNSMMRWHENSMAFAQFVERDRQTGIDLRSTTAIRPESLEVYSATRAIRASASSMMMSTSLKKPPAICAAFMRCGKWNAHVKDKLENKLHRLICDGSVTPQEAQSAIATDWITAYHKYLGANP
jgi:hypothetical protein